MGALWYTEAVACGHTAKKTVEPRIEIQALWTQIALPYSLVRPDLEEGIQARQLWGWGSPGRQEA